MRLLIDTNIVLDVLEQREPYYAESRQVMMLCETGAVEGCVSVLTFANIVYIMRKSLDADKIQQIYEALSGVFTFIDLRAEDMAKASRMKWKDFEDALQAATAGRIEADYIVTRNGKDFVDSSVPGMAPGELLEYLHGLKNE